MSQEAKVWFVTGSSTGLGRAIVEELTAVGEYVVATARDPGTLSALEGNGKLMTARVDVTNPDELSAAVAAGVARFGRIDVLVNNAGYGLFGAFEEISDSDARRQFEVNVFGLFAATRAVLPTMRRQGSGHIINISSVGGRVAFPSLSVYHATKFAVEGMSESLAQEVAPFGVKVTIVEPGSFRTDWSGRSATFAPPMGEYAATPAAYVRGLVKDAAGKEPGDPVRAARAIIEVARAAHPPLRLPLGTDALARIRERFQTDLTSMAEWEPLAVATAFP